MHIACGHCEFCISGWETLCASQQNSGYSVNGSFAEFALAAADFVGRIPEQLSFVDAGPILCAGVTTYKGLKETEARPGEWVVISGAGGLGHIAIQYARAMGLRVAAVDVGKEKLALARKLGAEVTADAAAEDPAAKIREATGAAHGVLVTAGSVQTSCQHASSSWYVRSGRIASGRVSSPDFDVVLNRYTIRGSIVGTRKDLAEALAFAAQGKVRATIEQLPLDSINEVFGRLKHGKVNGRVVLNVARA